MKKTQDTQNTSLNEDKTIVINLDMDKIREYIKKQNEDFKHKEKISNAIEKAIIIIIALILLSCPVWMSGINKIKQKQFCDNLDDKVSFDWGNSQCVLNVEDEISFGDAQKIVGDWIKANKDSNHSAYSSYTILGKNANGNYKIEFSVALPSGDATFDSHVKVKTTFHNILPSKWLEIKSEYDQPSHKQEESKEKTAESLKQAQDKKLSMIQSMVATKSL